MGFLSSILNAATSDISDSLQAGEEAVAEFRTLWTGLYGTNPPEAALQSIRDASVALIVHTNYGNHAYGVQKIEAAMNAYANTVGWDAEKIELAVEFLLQKCMVNGEVHQVLEWAIVPISTPLLERFRRNASRGAESQQSSSRSSASPVETQRQMTSQMQQSEMIPEITSSLQSNSAQTQQITGEGKDVAGSSNEGKMTAGLAFSRIVAVLFGVGSLILLVAVLALMYLANEADGTTMSDKDNYSLLFVYILSMGICIGATWLIAFVNIMRYEDLLTDGATILFDIGILLVAYVLSVLLYFLVPLLLEVHIIDWTIHVLYNTFVTDILGAVFFGLCCIACFFGVVITLIVDTFKNEVPGHTLH